MPKRTNQPSKKKRAGTHGYRKRQQDHEKVLKRRRKKGRKKMAVKVKSKRYK